MFRYLTAGESHGPQLTAIIEGVPAGFPLTAEMINHELARRQCGYGRGGRMKIETDRVEILSGVRWGKTLGSPITLAIRNRDWENWLEKMSPEPEHAGSAEPVTRVRPGHADLPGALKYDTRDARDILERSSARETAARVAVGAVARSILSQFGISVGGYVSEIGGTVASRPEVSLKEMTALAASSEVFTCDPVAETEMKELIDRMKAAGDTVGGVVEVFADGVPAGLGSHVQWDRKLDARLAMAAMSVQAIKGVEIGMGFEAARSPGSRVHDEIFYDPAHSGCRGQTGFFRKSNNAGGIEGGISNGETIRLRAAMKPIPTLYQPLASVDMVTKTAIEATVERSDVCAVPAALVVVEAVVAIEVAAAFLEKFGGDSLEEVRRNFDGFCRQIQHF